MSIWLVAVLCLGGCRGHRNDTQVSPPPTVSPAQLDPWREAANKVEEDRGEPTGRAAQVNVPAELKHYADPRRFLAIQLAESRKLNYPLPEDFPDLVKLIQEGSLVQMEPVGPEYILYGLGWSAPDGPFTHYDRSTRIGIPLYTTDQEFEQDIAAGRTSRNELIAKLVELRLTLRRTGKRDRARRRELVNEISASQNSLNEVSDRTALLESLLKDPDKKRQIESQSRALAAFAANFGGKSYDLANSKDRTELKVRILSFIRPQAREVLLRLASAYSRAFGRPLPVTSLVRSEEYQWHLGETNENATRTAVPPHTTGLAFDVYYRYMTGKEQDFLMEEIARMEAAGQVEALRETRNHFHIFAFPDGRPPDEELIAHSIRELGATGASGSRRPNHGSRGGRKTTPTGQLKRASRFRSGARPQGDDVAVPIGFTESVGPQPA